MPDDPILPNEHQLDKLPGLPPEINVFRHPIFILTCSFVVSGLISLFLAAYLHIDSSVVTQFLEGSLAVHTTGIGGFSADKFSRNQIYQKAAAQPLPNQ